MVLIDMLLEKHHVFEIFPFLVLRRYVTNIFVR
jgi:hypothetical protein